LITEYRYSYDPSPPEAAAVQLTEVPAGCGEESAGVSDETLTGRGAALAWKNGIRMKRHTISSDWAFLVTAHLPSGLFPSSPCRETFLLVPAFAAPFRGITPVKVTGTLPPLREFSGPVRSSLPPQKFIDTNSTTCPGFFSAILRPPPAKRGKPSCSGNAERQ
jgi:hypothetical protein